MCLRVLVMRQGTFLLQKNMKIGETSAYTWKNESAFFCEPTVHVSNG